MKLNAWLEKDPPLADRLRVIGSLCTALAEAHRRGEVRGGLTPATISIVNDGVARLDPGVVGPGSPYAAPELSQGAPPSPKSDIYSAASVIYEILAGSPPFDSDPPRPLQEARPGLSQDLTDAVSACMEQDPEWRPADLAYLSAVVEQLHREQPSPAKPQAPRQSSPRASGPDPTFLNPVPGKRRDDRSALTRALPLILVAVAIAGTGGAWLWYNVLHPAPASAPRPGAPRSPRAAPTTLGTRPSSAASTALAPAAEPAAEPTAEPRFASPAPAPEPRPSERAASRAPQAAPSPASTSRTTAPAAPKSALATAPPMTMPASALEASPAPSDPVPPPARESDTEPQPSADPRVEPQPAGPAAIRAVAPFKLRAGSLHVLDVHGSGLRADHRVKVVPHRKRGPAAGFAVTRYQVRNPGLLLVFVKLDGAVPAGKYSLSLVDAAGAETNAFTIEVTNK